MRQKLNSGFTLIELLVVISIVGFLAVSSVVVFNIVRMNARDSVRVGNIATIRRALAMYLNDSLTGYPPSTGECLSGGAGVGQEIRNAKVILEVPTDPLWPGPGAPYIPNPDVNSDSDGFCYWYVSSVKDIYQLSYFLESNSKSGDAGAHSVTQ